MEKDLKQVCNLIYSRVHIEHWQTKSKEIRGVKNRKQTCKISTKMVNQIPIFRPSQAFPTISIACWISLGPIPITSKPHNILKCAVSISRHWYFIEIKYHDSGICSMISLHILTPWIIFKLMVMLNCIFINCRARCHS